MTTVQSPCFLDVDITRVTTNGAPFDKVANFRFVSKAKWPRRESKILKFILQVIKTNILQLAFRTFPIELGCGKMVALLQTARCHDDRDTG